MHVVTDDERREVAERLRAYGKEFGDPTWRELCNVVFWDEDSYPTSVRKLHLIDRLADLIDPDCEEGRYSVARTVRPVDRDALLVLADELDGEGLDGWASGPVNVGEYARSIREACGEVVRNG